MSSVSGRSYQFADFIRWVAMCAIIFQHSLIVERSVIMTDESSMLLYYSLKVVAKIGSISFFLVSGYLLSSALQQCSTREYMSRRMSNIFKPYLLFALGYLIIDSAGAFYGQDKISEISALPEFVFNKIPVILFYTNYWFIFNYFISVFLLLAFRRYLYEQWLGLMLLGFTLFYSVNAHMELFPPHHTTAFAGFAFFLWLGANLQRNEERFWAFLDHTPYWKILVCVASFLFLNLSETYYFISLNATVFDSSLKFSNILYALSVFVLLCKLGRNATFTFFQPRDETYPLYLLHPILLKVINFGILPLLPAVGSVLLIREGAQLGWLTILVYQVGWFVAAYMLSYCAIRILLHSPLKWVFGKQAKVTLSSKSVESIVK